MKNVQRRLLGWAWPIWALWASRPWFEVNACMKQSVVYSRTQEVINVTYLLNIFAPLMSIFAAVRYLDYLFLAYNKPSFLRKILKIHIAYTLSQNKPMLHGNRFSRSPVMPAQTDRHTHRQTKKNFKNMIFVFSALIYICWYDLFKKIENCKKYYLIY